MQGPPIPRPNGSRGRPVTTALYDKLGVPVDATATHIKKAYRKSSLVGPHRHPDKGGTHEAFQALTHAYEILSNEEKRHCYDAFGSNYEKIPGIEFFKQQLKSKDMGLVMSLTLAECLRGKDCEVKYKRVTQNGMAEHMTHTFYIPPGTHHQHQFLFSGLGHREPGKLPGNLVVVVNEQEHKEFQRFGNVLIHKKNISLAEAVTGSPLRIDHPNGDTFFIQQSACFKNDAWYEIPGRGGTASEAMFVHIHVDFPDLTDQQKAQLINLLQFKPVNAKSPISVSEVPEQHLKMAIQRSRNEEESHTDSKPGCPMQ